MCVVLPPGAAHMSDISIIENIFYGIRGKY